MEKPIIHIAIDPNNCKIDLIKLRYAIETFKKMMSDFDIIISPIKMRNDLETFNKIITDFNIIISPTRKDLDNIINDSNEKRRSSIRFFKLPLNKPNRHNIMITTECMETAINDKTFQSKLRYCELFGNVKSDKDLSPDVVPYYADGQEVTKEYAYNIHTVNILKSYGNDELEVGIILIDSNKGRDLCKKIDSGSNIKLAPFGFANIKYEDGIGYIKDFRLVSIDLVDEGYNND